jgi:hypothetical protein
LTAARLYFDSPPVEPKNWGWINPNHNDYHSDPIEISSTFWLRDITDWWHLHEETHLKYPDPSNVAHDISSMIQHGVGLEARLFLVRDIVRWRLLKTTGETLSENVIATQYAWADIGILACNDPVLDTTEVENDVELKSEAEE